MNELHLFSGCGGGILGGMLLGHTCVCAVEIEPYCRKVLLQRQRDGILPKFPIWDRVETFDGRPWRGLVDVVCGGFPCQDISVAGKGAGITGERSGLWREMARIIGEVRPRYAFVENSPALLGRGVGVVLGDLAEMGYDARWGVLGACDAGAPHKRERIWILAYPMPSGERGITWQSQAQGNAVADSNSAQRQGNERTERIKPEHLNPSRSSWWSSEPDVGRVANGVANRVDRLKSIGNGQVPSVAALAWRILASL